ncbi:MAG: dihydroxy-acid dehydratase, partial [Chloroflexi bacterium]|nr:dihydroxy-acid dehydratase [Chloroflexota bacterium]
QCCAGQIRGMETVLHELTRNGVPMTLDAPTVAGKTWRERLDEGRAAGNLSADGVTDPSKRIILSTPRRAVSGVDVLAGNWFESAVVKISGMPDAQLNEFDEQVAAVVYFENEDDANAALLDVKFVSGKLEARLGLTFETLRAIHTHNSRRARGDEIPADELLPAMLKGGTLKIAIVVSGQGPEAYGMPEMATPNLYINADVFLRRLTTLISDGRYSGVSYGAAVGHVTPEAARGGGILYLRDGDLLHLRLHARRIDLLDPSAFARGEIRSWPGDLAADRAELGRERLARIQKRRMEIAPTNQMIGYSDAAHGVVPPAVMAAAGERVEITK